MIEFIPLQKKHLELVMKWRLSPEVSRYLNTDISSDMDKHIKWFQKIKSDQTSIYWLIKYKNTLVGLNSLNDIDWRNRFCYGTFYIGDPKVKAIIGYIVPHLTLNYIFNHTILNKSIANIFKSNINVVRLYEHIGYKRVGTFQEHIFKNDEYHDVVLLEYKKSEWIKNKDKFSKYNGKFSKGT